MSDASDAFEFVSERLEAATGLRRIEARGTVRLALREVGKDPTSVSIADMHAVTRKVLPAMLTPRGVRDAASICEGIARALSAAPLRDRAGSVDPAEVFSRLGRDRTSRG